MNGWVTSPSTKISDPVLSISGQPFDMRVTINALVRRQTMAQYAVLIYAGDSAHGSDATPEDLAAHNRYAQELQDAGCMAAAFALEPIATATTIRGDVVTDGPFVDAKEVVAGFYVIDAPDLDAALRIAGRNPATQQGGGVEVRPVAGGFVRSPARG
jgi:hypothetical protein